MGIEDHLTIVIVIDDRTEPAPYLTVGFLSGMKRQHLPILKDGAAATHRALHIALSPREAYPEPPSAEAGNNLEQRDGSPPPGPGGISSGYRSAALSPEVWLDPYAPLPAYSSAPAPP